MPHIGRTMKTQWLEALKTHAKAKGELCHFEEGQVPSYCCLGVLADADEALMVQYGNPQIWVEVDIENEDGEPPLLGQQLRSGWVDASELNEEYPQHPRLSMATQSILMRANDYTERFEDVVAPLIEILLNEDLTTKREHVVHMDLMFRFGNRLGKTDDYGKHQTMQRVLTDLEDGMNLPDLLTKMLDQDETKGATDG